MDIVVRFFQALGDNGTLPLKLLSQTVALLMALVEASRVSELHALDLRYGLYCPEGVVFSVEQEDLGLVPRQEEDCQCLI